MYLALDTKFNPFTYAEMVQPLLYYKDAYEKTEAAYSDLASQTEAWKDIANQQNSPEAYAMYKKYSDDLSKVVDDFSKGMTAGNRRQLLNMKRRYAKEITPIETAYKRREELAAEQRKAIAANPTMMYQRMANTLSLDDFIKNPSLDYGAQYSGALLTQQVATAAANIAKEARDSEEGKRLLRRILPYQYEMLQQTGFSRDAVMEAILNSPNADKILTGIVEDAITSSGVKEWGDEATQRRAYDYARQGLYNAIGQTQYKMVTDQAGLAAFQAYLQDRNARMAEDRAAARQKQDMLKMYDINPTSLYGTSETAEQNKATLDQLDKWKNKGYINSEGQLTPKGWAAIRDQLLYDISGAASSDSPYVRARSYDRRDKDFMDWASSHGVQYSMPTKVSNLDAQGKTSFTYTEPQLRSYEGMTNYYNSTRQGIARGELVTGTPNIDVYRQGVRSKTDQDYLLNKTTAALAGGKIYEVGTLTESNGKVTMGRGKGISAKDFRKLATDNPILYIINSPTTDNQLIELSDGSKFIMPKGMLDNINQGNISGTNSRIVNAESDVERAVNLNQANSYLGSLLNYNEGTGIATNEGYIRVPISR